MRQAGWRTSPFVVKSSVLIVMASALIGWAGWWLLERHRAVQTLREEVRYGLSCRSVNGQSEVAFPDGLGWRCHYPWAGPTLVHIDYSLPRGARLGSALSHFGTLRIISVGQGTPNEIDALFTTLGRQDALRSLYVFNVPVDDLFCRHLSLYPKLIDIGISPSNITGGQIPLLAHLENLDLTFAPISDAGFRRLLSLPSLQRLSLDAPGLTLAGLQAVLDVKSPPASIGISDSDLPPEQVRFIVEAYRKKWPKARLDVN